MPHAESTGEKVVARAWQQSDRDACLALFDSNVPKFFAPEEREQFRHYLGTLDPAHYLVLLLADQIVACGGLDVDRAQHQATLSWGMVDRGFHRAGLGTRLTEARLALARSLPGIDRIVLITSQHTHAFYERFGFQTISVTPDGIAKGLDRWDMVLPLRG